MAKAEQIDETRIKRPDGKYRETFWITAEQLMTAHTAGMTAITLVFTQLIQHANQIGLMGRVVLEWEASDDVIQVGAKKIVLITQDYEEWAREADDEA